MEVINLSQRKYFIYYFVTTQFMAVRIKFQNFPGSDEIKLSIEVRMCDAHRRHVFGIPSKAGGVNYQTIKYFLSYFDYSSETSHNSI